MRRVLSPGGGGALFLLVDGFAVLHALVQLLRVRYTDKETTPQLMIRYLTNAAEAIPIVVFLTDTFVEIGNWGPRPVECKRLIARGKAAGKIDEAYAKIKAFYTADNHKSTIAELRALLDIAVKQRRKNAKICPFQPNIKPSRFHYSSETCPNSRISALGSTS